MPQLVVNTVSGVRAFTLDATPSHTVKQLQVAAARKACVIKKSFTNMKLVDVKDDVPVRLSLGRTFLSPKETVAELGLKNGTVLVLHVNKTPLVRSQAPLPTFSFGAEGYGFFVRVVTPSGQPLFKHKVTPRDLLSRVMAAILKKA